MRRPPSPSGLYRSAIAGLPGPRCPDNSMSGIWEDFMGIVGKGGATVVSTVEAKAAKLEKALTVILIFSGVAATASVINLLRRR